MRVQWAFIIALAANAFTGNGFSQVSQSPPAAKPLTTTIEGRISKVEFTTPHMYIYVGVTVSDGEKPTTWTIQTGSLSELTAKGIKRSDLQVGRNVRVEGTPLPGENRLEAP